MHNGVYVKMYADIPVDTAEALRYARQKEQDERIALLFNACVEEAACSLGVCYAVLTADEAGTLLGEAVKKRLGGATYALVFAATAGLGIDRLIARYAVTAPSKALLLQGLGAERIESLCNTFCEEIKAACLQRGYAVTPRFSPGYGNIPVEKQREIFSLLCPEKRIGLTLNDSLMMTPAKSVTAIFGIGKQYGL
ncbi:MAG: hypothetical protein IJX88_00185 [Clostridia bacterium]|nr:hypothetical protein [Clostridia bacterium]